MAEFSEKLKSVLMDRGWDKSKAGKEEAAKELCVSRASFYNYLTQKDLAGLEVFRRAHDLWGIKLKHMDFGVGTSPSPIKKREEGPRQYVLPFIQSVNENDVEIVQAKPIGRDTLQLTVNIRFAG
jgi:hypothetical protein